MRELDGSEGHVIITDPPYSEHVHASAVSQSVKGGARSRDLGFAHLSPEVRDHLAKLTARVPRWSVIYADIEGVGAWLDALDKFGATYLRTVPWVRWSMPQLSGDRPPQGSEMVIHAWGSQKGPKDWNGPGNLTHYAHTCLRGDEKHPTEKPLDQALDLVEFFSNPGETVLDPFAGSGVIGLACRMLGRGYVGTELQACWVDKANARIGMARSDRDQERFERWQVAKAVRDVEMARMAENTAKYRAKAEAKKKAELARQQPAE